MSDTQTEGMIKLPDGSYLGSVGITLTPKDIEEADYTGGTSTNVTSEKIITALSEIENKIEAGVTTLIASSNIKNELAVQSIKATIKSAEMIRDSNILLSKVVTNFATAFAEASNKSLQMSSHIAGSEFSHSVENSMILEESQALNQNVKDLITAIKESRTVVNASGDVAFNLDTAPIVQSLNTMAQNQSATNTKIVEGIENQKETNAKIVENITKKNEHLDFLKNGDSNVKDSSGNIIKPREIEAKKNAEQFIEQKDTNETDFNDIEDFVNSALGIVDEVTDTLGATDGFSLFVNPLEVIDRILVEDYINNQDGEKQQ